MEIREINEDNFLSAGEMPLPELYFMMALLFFLSGCFWVFILKKSKYVKLLFYVIKILLTITLSKNIILFTGTLSSKFTILWLFWFS